MDPTNFRVETVRKAIIVDQTLQSENQELSLWEEELATLLGCRFECRLARSSLSKVICASVPQCLSPSAPSLSRDKHSKLH
jgi:hypothetical protein